MQGDILVNSPIIIRTNEKLSMKFKNKYLLHLKYFGAVCSYFVITIFLLSGCEDNSQEFSLGKEYIEYQTKTFLIDTFSVDLSTIAIDTLTTSGTGRHLLGHYSDELFGKINSKSYFQVDIPESFDVLDDDIYDSLSLVLKYDAYSLGDTTKSQKISVHRLTDNIELNSNSAISNITTFDYDPEAIGSITYTPTPNITTDSLVIKIDDETGMDFFTKLRDDSEIFTNSSNFLNYFKGLVLVADESYAGAIIGFTASEDDTRLVLHTSRNEALSVDEILYEFNLCNTEKQFNQINRDFSQTQLSSLTNQRTKLTTEEASGFAYLQGGSGLAVRIDFPTLDEILLYDRGTVVEARLEISPYLSAIDIDDLPSELSIYQCGKLNQVTFSAYDTQELTTANEDDPEILYEEDAMYSFDITSYIIDELSDSYIDPDQGLAVTLPVSSVKYTFERLIINANSENTKLKIYYLSY